MHAPFIAASQTLATLASADRAWDVLSGALSLPTPDPDLDGAWHLYLLDEVPGGGAGLLESRDPRARLDRGVTFAVVGRSIPVGCALDMAVARAVAGAALRRATPATDEGTARVESEAVARLAVACSPDGTDTLEFQQHPERAIVDPSSADFDRGAAHFFTWLDETFAREPAALLRGVWALAPTRTPPESPRWIGSPTGFDVLRASLKGALGTGTTLDDVFARFGVQRSEVTPGPRLAWHLPWPAKPRRLASPEPLAPTGASYVLVEHEGAAPGSKLRMEVEWEDYARMRWFVLKLDANGRTMAALPVTSLDRGTSAALTVESLEGVDRVLVIGANVGSTEHPFDPSQGDWERHGWLLTLEAE